MLYRWIPYDSYNIGSGWFCYNIHGLMSKSECGKGDRYRKVNRKLWEMSWARIERQRKRKKRDIPTRE